MRERVIFSSSSSYSNSSSVDSGARGGFGMEELRMEKLGIENGALGGLRL
jgi:hypothetical protein